MLIDFRNQHYGFYPHLAIILFYLGYKLLNARITNHVFCFVRRFLLVYIIIFYSLWLFICVYNCVRGGIMHLRGKLKKWRKQETVNKGDFIQYLVICHCKNTWVTLRLHFRHIYVKLPPDQGPHPCKKVIEQVSQVKSSYSKLHQN